MTPWVVKLASQHILRVQHEDEGMLVAHKVGGLWRRARIRNRQWCPVRKALDGYVDDGELSTSYTALLKYLGVDMAVGYAVMT